MEVNRQDILKMFAYHSLCDSLKSNSRKRKTNEIKDGEREKGGGAKIALKQSVLNANHGAYRRLSGLIGFGRPVEFGLYRPRLLPAQPALAWPMAYRPAYQRPGPLGTLLRSTHDRANRSDHSRAKLDHDLIVSITSPNLGRQILVECDRTPF